MLTEYLATRNNPLDFARAGAQLGLEARGQDLSEQEAGNRLRLSYDTLSQDRDLTQRQTAAINSLKASQMDAMTNYRNQQIEEQRERLKQAADKTSAAADALNQVHKDTAGFVSDAEKLGAATALVKYPNADKTVVNHVMALEQAKAKPVKTDKLPTVSFAAPGIGDVDHPASLFRFNNVPANSELINTSLGTTAPPGTGTNYAASLTAPPAQGGDILSKAKDAIAKGADKAKVNARLVQAGLQPLP
jgi:hypothetical protein